LFQHLLNGFILARKEVLVPRAGSTRDLVSQQRWLLVGVVLLLCSFTGCGSGPKVIPFSQAEKTLSSIALAYMEAHARLGHGPKNADELKPFLKDFGNPEELLVSPNDGQPYVIVWGVDPTRGGPTEYQGMWPILAYERKGAGGARAITDIRGRPMRVPEADFPKLTFAGRHKPTPS
jgi:hypothetical protein